MQSDMGTMRAQCFYVLYIGFGYLLCFIVGVAHFVAAEFALAAYITFTCHAVILRNE